MVVLRDGRYGGGWSRGLGPEVEAPGGNHELVNPQRKSPAGTMGIFEKGIASANFECRVQSGERVMLL